MTALPAPEVETARLRLRAPVKADFPAVAAFHASDRTVFMGGPRDAAAAWRLFCATAAPWVFDGYGYWAVERREDAALVGAVGFIGPPAFPECELGWELYDGCEGRGYATEAASAARDWWFGAFGGDTLVSYVDPANARSIAVAERLGATRDAHAPRVDADDIVFRHAGAA